MLAFTHCISLADYSKRLRHYAHLQRELRAVLHGSALAIMASVSTLVTVQFEARQQQSYTVALAF